jgi:hypothetical protein
MRRHDINAKTVEYVDYMMEAKTKGILILLEDTDGQMWGTSKGYFDRDIGEMFVDD